MGMGHQPWAGGARLVVFGALSLGAGGRLGAAVRVAELVYSFAREDGLGQGRVRPEGACPATDRSNRQFKDRRQ